MTSISKSVPWRWKLWLLNTAAMIYFLALSLGSLVIGVFITLPDVYKHDPDTLHRRKILAVYVFIVMILNYICLKFYSRHSQVSAEYYVLPRTSINADTMFCRSCDLPVPGRAKHCPLCDVCVLKRDHHCFFGGCCIGFHNQRYFIVFCLYGSVGMLYSTFVTLSFLADHYVNILSSQFYAFLVPWLLWYWFMGRITINIVAMVLFSYFCALTFVACCYFFSFQCFLLVRGQTSYEFVKGIKRYRCTLGESLRSVFGPFWGLNLIVPLPFLKSPDNGIDWKVVHEFKQM